MDTFTAGESALNQMVDNALVVQEGKKRGIVVSDEEVETNLQEALGYYANGTPTPTNTDAPVATSTLSPAQLGMLMPTATATLTPTPSLTETLATATTDRWNQPLLPTEPATPKPPRRTAPTPTPYTLEGYQSVYATMVADFETNYQIPEETVRYIVTVQLFREKLQEQVLGVVPAKKSRFGPSTSWSMMPRWPRRSRESWTPVKTGTRWSRLIRRMKAAKARAATWAGSAAAKW